MTIVADPSPESPAKAYVPETRFGNWFLKTYTWRHHVLRVAIEDLLRLSCGMVPSSPVILDAGCGHGQSLPLLARYLSPSRLIGFDCFIPGLADAEKHARATGTCVELRVGDCSEIPMSDASCDIVFCHQTFHHLVYQEAALAEFYRVLKPGGLLLFAESTEAYIRSWVIRLLFRHPMHVQRSAAGYLDMIRAAGFTFASENVSYPYLWWSRAKDFGLLERLKLQHRPVFGEREETLVNVVARKPLV
nr:class I SAM-dependent methyltransferase [Pandoraea sp. ISTKB]